jgi:hypothetical protein
LEILTPDSTKFILVSETLFAGGQARPQYHEFILLSSYKEHKMLHLYRIKKEPSPWNLDLYNKSNDSVALCEDLQYRDRILRLLFSEVAVKVGRRGENKLGGGVFPVFVFRIGIPILLTPVI